MARSDTSPRPRIIPSTTASPLLSPTGPPCTKTSSPTETNQASAMLSRLTTRTKARSSHNTPTTATEKADYFSRKPPGYSRANTGTQELKGSGSASAYVSFPEFDQYQRRDAITADGR